MPDFDRHHQRLWVDQPLVCGQPVALDKAQSNYLCSVLRLKAGADILLFNGRDGEFIAQLSLAGRSVSLIPRSQTRPQTAPTGLWACFAPLKHARLDYMVQKMTEMGASRLQPVLTQHTQVHRLNLQRMRANVIEAAEQCGILAVPDVCEPVSLTTLLGNWPHERTLIVCDEAAPDVSPLPVLAGLNGSCAVLIGPEGGFSAQERDMLGASTHVVSISLGPRILRADTAMVAALALIEASHAKTRGS